MIQAVSKKNDIIDLVVNYFTKEARDFFRAINNVFFLNKHLIGKETRPISKGLKAFSAGADIFNLADMACNFNDIRNHLNGKKVSKDVPLLLSDTTLSVSESAAWLSTAGILSLSALATSWVTSISGITLMISFSKRSIQDINELKKPYDKNEPKDLKERKLKIYSLAKNISFFAMGVLLFLNGWFAIALNITLMTLFSTSAIISSFISFYIKNRNDDSKEVLQKTPIDPKRVATPDNAALSSANV